MTAIRPVDLDDVEVVTQTRTRVNRVACRINVDATGRSFGDRLRASRTGVGLTRQRLADIIGLSVYTIQHAELNRGKAIQAHTVGALAEALGVSMDDLWFGRGG